MEAYACCNRRDKRMQEAPGSRTPTQLVCRQGAGHATVTRRLCQMLLISRMRCRCSSRNMHRYLFHVHLLGRITRDCVGSFHANDSRAVACGRSFADKIAENDGHQSVIVTVERAGGPVLARVTARKGMPPWQSASSRFEHAWRELAAKIPSSFRARVDF